MKKKTRISIEEDLYESYKGKKVENFRRDIEIEEI